MELTRIKLLKKGTYFVIGNQGENIKESVVWIRGDYDRSSKKYSCYKFSDVNHETFFSPDKHVYTDFTF